MHRTITQEEWIAQTQKNIDAAAKELLVGKPLRAYVDTLLNQMVEDLRTQYDNVNKAFMRRISEYKETKTKLENQHFEVCFISFKFIYYYSKNNM